MSGATVTCGQCGWRFADGTDAEALRDHAQHCRRPPWYWWPREHPWKLAVLMLAVGFLVGLVLR